MIGKYRPARDIQPGWHVRLADTTERACGWMPVLARLDTITATGLRRVWLLGDGLVTIAGADDPIRSRTPAEAAGAAAAHAPHRP